MICAVSVHMGMTHPLAHWQPYGEPHPLKNERTSFPMKGAPRLGVGAYDPPPTPQRLASLAAVISWVPCSSHIQTHLFCPVSPLLIPSCVCGLGRGGTDMLPLAKRSTDALFAAVCPTVREGEPQSTTQRNFSEGNSVPPRNPLNSKVLNVISVKRWING